MFSVYMKRLLLTFSFALAACAAVTAQDSGIEGDGYYRVRNKGTERYIYVKDNTGDYYADIVDYGAVQLWRGIERTVSDPASVIYICKVSSGKYDLRAQGTGTYELVQHHVEISLKSDGAYEVSASQSGVTKYLSDISSSTTLDRGILGDGGRLNNRKWIVDKIETGDETNYFGVTPTVSADGKWYCPFYAAFPFSVASEGMKVYYIDIVDKGLGVAVLKEIKGTVPSSTPVIIECSSQNPSDNRLDIKMKDVAAIKGNLLKGTYFANEERPKSKDSYTLMDTNKIRVLNVVDGKLSYDIAGPSVVELLLYINYEDVLRNCVAANHSYLAVDESAQDVMQVLTEEEYLKVGIDGVVADNKEELSAGVFNMQGVRLRDNGDTTGLPSGIYIVDGRKVCVK